MAYDYFPLNETASLRFSFHKSTTAVTVAFFDGKRMYFSMGVQPYTGTKLGQVRVYELPWEIPLKTCHVTNVIFTHTPNSGKKKGSVRFQGVVQQEGKKDKKINTILVEW